MAWVSELYSQSVWQMNELTLELVQLLTCLAAFTLLNIIVNGH